MIYLRLLFEFFKVGLFSIGGGLATVPFLTELGRNTGWFTTAELADMIAVSESTPGPIGVNMAVYVGMQTGRAANGLPGGILGAIVAPLGLTIPSFLVILLVIRILNRFRNSPWVSALFSALRPASLALITCAAWEVLQIILYSASGTVIGPVTLPIDWKALLLGALLIVPIRKIKCHPAWFLLASAVFGIVFQM